MFQTRNKYSESSSDKSTYRSFVSIKPSPIHVIPENQAPQRCNSCGYHSLYVNESRRTRDGVRRRYACSKCGYRDTRYELDSETYKKFKEAFALKTKLVGLLAQELGTLSSMASEPPQILCDTCTHWNKSVCSFGFPESGTPDAVDCGLFKPKSR